MKSLANAQIFNSDAEKTIIGAIEKDIMNAATSTQEIIGETATTTPEIIKETAVEAPVTLMASSTSLSATSTPKKIILEEDNAQTLIEKSLKEIKNAYTSFISISNKVSLKLRLK